MQLCSDGPLVHYRHICRTRNPGSSIWITINIHIWKIIILPDCCCALHHHQCSNRYTVAAKLWQCVGLRLVLPSTIGAVHSDPPVRRVLWTRHPRRAAAHRCCCPPSANVAACSKEMCAVPPTMAIHQQEVTTIRRTTSMISTWTIYSYYHKALQLVAACCSPRFLQAT